jgi:hypothetical protein
MRRWSVTRILSCALSVAIGFLASAGEPASPRVCVGSFHTEGLSPKVVEAARTKVIQDLRSLGAAIACTDEVPSLSRDCYRDASCLRMTVAGLEFEGLLEVEILRFGPMLRMVFRSYDATTGEKLVEKTLTTSTRGFPASAKMRPVLGKSLAPIPRKQPVPDPPPKPSPPEVRTVTAPKPPPAPVERVDAGVRKKSSLSTWGWVTVSLGGALLVSGTITGSLALSLNSDLADACEGGVCPEGYRGKDDRKKNLALSTDVLVGVGAATVIAGVLILTVFDVDTESGSSVEVAPAVAPGYAGAAIQGRF